MYQSHMVQIEESRVEKKLAFYRHAIFSVFLAFISIVFLTGCFNNPANENIHEEQEKIDAFYDEFLTAFSGTSYDDVVPYLHFEDEVLRQEMMENFKPIFDCKIASKERLAENFWVFHVYMTSIGSSYIDESYHFIGEIDGNLQVMIGRYAVPASHRNKTDIDILQFKPENALDREDTIIVK